MEKLFIRLCGEWMEYAGVASHGTMFEETKWTDTKGSARYIDTPPKLMKAMEQLIVELHS